MYIYLPEVRLRSGEAVDYSFLKKLSDCFNDFLDEGTIKLSVSASLSGEKLMINGSLEVTSMVNCSRCLELFEQYFKTDFTEVFAVSNDALVDSSPELLAEEAANRLTVTGDYLYIDEYIRQLIILAQEYSPLCKNDCRGICAGCGADLNKHSCYCSKENNQVDARLLKLKELNSGSNDL